MSLTPFNGDVTQALKWLQNKAPNITQLLTSKEAWYTTYEDQFWSNWATNVFDIRQCNNFGLAIWCAILGLPQTPFNLNPAIASWAFGPNRQNYIYSGTDLPTADQSTGGNFYGSGDVLNSLQEIRQALQLRYVNLTHGGNVADVNRMLKYIFNVPANAGIPWGLPAGQGNYAFVADNTLDGSSGGTMAQPTSGPFIIEYRFGPALKLSPQFIAVLNDGYGILPSFAGSKITAIQGT